jgi:hypothetical protein
MSENAWQDTARRRPRRQRRPRAAARRRRRGAGTEGVTCASCSSRTVPRSSRCCRDSRSRTARRRTELLPFRSESVQVYMYTRAEARDSSNRFNFSNRPMPMYAMSGMLRRSSPSRHCPAGGKRPVVRDGWGRPTCTAPRLQMRSRRDA